MNRRAVFLDRDGTINVEKHYLFQPEAFEFYPGAVDAIGRLNKAGFVVVVVTNQSGIARGYFSEQDVEALHRYMDCLLEEAGVRVDGYYYCPHHPEHGDSRYRKVCNCRKGKPGMLEAAGQEYGLSLRDSFLVGDRGSDIEAAKAVGSTPILVKTGYGEATHGEAVAQDVVVASDLGEAVEWILQQTTGDRT